MFKITVQEIGGSFHKEFTVDNFAQRRSGVHVYLMRSSGPASEPIAYVPLGFACVGYTDDYVEGSDSVLVDETPEMLDLKRQLDADDPEAPGLLKDIVLDLLKEETE